MWDTIGRAAHVSAGAAGELLNPTIEEITAIYERLVEQGRGAARGGDRAVAYANMQVRKRCGHRSLRLPL